MLSLTFAILATVLVNFFCANPATALRSYQRRRDLDNVKPVSELGWNVPLLSGKVERKRSLINSHCAHFLLRHTCSSSSRGRYGAEVPDSGSWYYDL
jgi:hypothetical protein